VNKKETGKEYSEFMRQCAERYERLMPKPTVLEVFCDAWLKIIAVLLFMTCFLIALTCFLIACFGAVFVFKLIWNLV